jgi:hypothetical protein
MPVILEADQFKPWLSGSAGLEMLKPAPNDVLQKWPVSRRVNSSRASDDDETLVDPILWGTRVSPSTVSDLNKKMLVTAPGPKTASGWLPEFIKDLFRRS